MKLLVKGNSKIRCLAFDLSPTLCVNKCNKCYAFKAEIWPNVRKKRQANYEASLLDSFEDVIIADILGTKYSDICRIHSSGDMYSQEYLNKWTRIISSLPNKKFYCYTKRKSTNCLDFSVMDMLPNMNVIDSVTEDGGYNFGNKEYCDSLVSRGYTLCGCETGVDIKCMDTCLSCLTEKKVCFLTH